MRIQTLFFLPLIAAGIAFPALPVFRSVTSADHASFPSMPSSSGKVLPFFQEGDFTKEITAVLKQQVLEEAAWAMEQRPVTVTASSSPRSAGGPHDFFSEADYFWPDPASPDSPYVNRDGMTNPDNFVAHRKAMIRLSRVVGALASAYTITGDEKYVRQALDHCRAWFVDTATRMNPSLNFAQAIRHRVTGRGIGIIDTIHLMEVVQGLLAMEGAQSMDKGLLDAIRQWFAEYIHWLTTSSFGMAEMKTANNHGTCFTMQLASFAKFTHDEQWMDVCRERFKKILLPAQMAADGSFPLELKRTKPYGYSLFNLDAMATLCQLLSTKGDDLWSYETADGRSVRKGIGFLYPYIADKSKWTLAPDVMYWKEWPVAQPALVFGAVAYGRKDWFDTWKRLDHAPANEEVIRNLPVRHPLIWIGRSGMRDAAGSSAAALVTTAPASSPAAVGTANPVTTAPGMTGGAAMVASVQEGVVFADAETQTQLLLQEIAASGKSVPRDGGPMAKAGASAASKATPVAAGAAPDAFSPRTLENGRLKLVASRDWTSGFFPGELWMLYQYTHKQEWKERAMAFTDRMEREKTNGGTHDMGFKIWCSFGNGYRLTMDPRFKKDFSAEFRQRYRDVILQSARTLATRFNPATGCIRSWDHHENLWRFPVIIDNMMNLELLFEATKLSGDSSFYRIAVSHANTTMINHFRSDFSSFHVVDYDTATGKVVRKMTWQGYSDGSAWARGQAWGLYAYTMCYRETKDPAYLRQAEGIAGFILQHPHLPEDKVPYWDFNAPNSGMQMDTVPRDASAGAIIAAGLCELSRYSHNRKEYMAAADKILRGLTLHYRSPVGQNRGFILLHSTGSRPFNSEVDVPINYADYYYLEALLRAVE